MQNELHGALCVEYSRISDKRQSTHSIAAQKQICADFIQRNGLQLLASFSDEGVSAKSFNRGDWKRLCAFIKSLPGTPRVIVVVSAYDRFSRNAGEALQFLERFEVKHNCTVISATQYIPIPVTDPFFFSTRAAMLVQAQTERMITGRRVKSAMVQAAKQGRCVYGVPNGYERRKTDSGPALITINEKKAAVLKRMAEMCINGHTDAEIKRMANKAGFECWGNDRVKQILTNRFYLGEVYVPATEKEPGGWVRGGHDPIFTQAEFDAVQAARKKSRSFIRNPEDPTVPLRSHVLCSLCEKPLTGGPSRGRYSKYWYYRCHKCAGQNFSAEKAHNHLAQILGAMQIDSAMLAQIKRKTEEIIKAADSERRNKLAAASDELSNINAQIDDLEIRYIKREVEPALFKKWRDNWAKKAQELESEVQMLSGVETDVSIRALNTLFPKLSNLSNIFDKAGPHQKRALLSFIFPQGLMMTKNGYRTAKVNDIIKYNELNNSMLEFDAGVDNTDNNGNSCAGSPGGYYIEQLFALANALAA